MRFLLDESAEYRLTDLLRSLGHDVTAIAHDYPQALPDDEVLGIARREQRILITNDRDFGELIVREGLPHTGVIFFRIPVGTADRKIERLEQVLAEYGDHVNRFLVVGDDYVRVR